MALEAHHVSGRVRFKIAGLRDNGSLILTLPRALRSCPGVDRVEVRPASNSLIVYYCPARIDLQAMTASVDAGLGAVTAAKPAPQLTSKAGERPREVVRDEMRAERDVVDTIRHLGVVFGHTAFKAALEQAVQAGLRSLYRVAFTRN